MPEDTFVYSTDTAVERMCAEAGMTYDEGFKTFIRDAEKECKEGLRNAMDQHRDIVWDQTNLSAKKRKSIITRFDQHPNNYSKFLVNFFHTKEEHVPILAKRLASRPGKTIPKEIVAAMVESYEKPTYDEGWEHITNLPLGIEE